MKIVQQTDFCTFNKWNKAGNTGFCYFYVPSLGETIGELES